MRKRAKCGCSSCQGRGLSVFVSTLAEEGIIKESLGDGRVPPTPFLGAHANRGWQRGGTWHPCLLSLASTALLIKKEDLGMIRGADLAEGGGRRCPTK